MDNKSDIYAQCRSAVEKVIDKFYDSGFDPCIDYMGMYDELVKKVEETSIKKRAEEYAKSHIKANGDVDINKYINFVSTTYVNAVNEQREIDVDKACEWLENNIHDSIMRDNIVHNFKEAMKGE